MLNEQQKQELDRFVEKKTNDVEIWADADDLYYRAGCMCCNLISADGVHEYTDHVPEELSEQAIGYIDGKYCNPSFHMLTRDEMREEWADCIRREA